MAEIVRVAVGGRNFYSWIEVAIDASVKEAARSFTLKASLKLGSGDATAKLFMPPAKVQIFARDELLVTGFVDRFRPFLHPREVGFTVASRATGADAVDCSADHTKGDYVDKTLLDVAKDQDAFGIGFTADFPMDKIDRTRPNIGESLFGFLNAHVDDAMCTMAGQADGSVKFTQAGKTAKRQPGRIVEADTYHSGEADHDWSKRHSEVHVHGQGHKGTGASATQIHAVSKDPAVTRHRPLHIVHPGHTDSDRAAKRAKHHRDCAAGEGTRLSYKSPTWRDNTGALWVPGNKVWVEVPTLNLVQDMLIERVSWRKSADQGEYSQLDLVDPAAHGGTGGGVNKSDAVWATPK